MLEESAQSGLKTVMCSRGEEKKKRKGSVQVYIFVLHTKRRGHVVGTDVPVKGIVWLAIVCRKYLGGIQKEGGTLRVRVRGSSWLLLVREGSTRERILVTTIKTGSVPLRQIYWLRMNEKISYKTRRTNTNLWNDIPIRILCYTTV